MTWPHSARDRQAAPRRPGPPPLFAGYSQSQLIGLGVGRPLLSTIGKITTEEQLLEFAECVPQLTADVLLALYDGASVDEVHGAGHRPGLRRRTGRPGGLRGGGRPARLARHHRRRDAAGHPRTEASTAGRCTCTPSSGEVVERSYSGPARVSGARAPARPSSPCTGSKMLVQQLPSGSSGKDVLFTTFNKNLAADLRKRLLLLGGPELLDRVDVVNIDQLAIRVVTRGPAGRPAAT